MKAEQFSTQLLRQKNLKIELKDMKAHQNIIGTKKEKKDKKKKKKN